MRLPRVSPTHNDRDWLSKQIRQSTPEVIQKIARLTAMDREGRYLHWDDLQHREPPEDLTREQWWAGLQFARISQQRAIPMLDRDGNAFHFVEPDAVRRNERWIDSFASGQILMPEIGDALTNHNSKGKYLVKSQIEEAFTSSRLEGAVTTRQIAKEMIREGRQPRNRSERMTLNNYEAMQFINRNRNTQLTPAFVLELHRIVAQDAIDNPAMAGRLRESDDVHVYDGDDEVVHTPPSFTELPRRLADFCHFANQDFDTPDSSTFIHPVVQATILHFMIGYDHPFVDGNGRTARALFYWLMIRRGYWLTEFISISRILLQAPTQYARAYQLTETDGGDLTYFIDYHLHIVRRAFESLQEYLRHKQQQAVDFAHARANSPDTQKLNQRQFTLLQELVKNPTRTLTIRAHERESNVSYLTARKDLLDLVEFGLLLRQGRGPQTRFIAPADLKEKLAVSN